MNYGINYILSKMKYKENTAPLVLITLALLLYNYFWDIITGSKIFAFNSATPATVWDMGAFYGRLWSSIHSATIASFLFGAVPAPIVLILSPFSLIKNPFIFVYLQTFWISITAVPIYFISLKELKSRTVSVLLSLSFLLFFGIAGLNWFDIHFQTLFIPLFMGGIALFYYGKYRYSALLMILSGFTHFLFPIFPILFYLIYAFEKKLRKEKLVSFKMLLIPALISLFILIAGTATYYYLVSPSFIISSAHASGLSLGSIWGDIANNNLNSKMEMFFLYFIPFLSLPLLSKRWLPSILIYLAELLFFGSFVFHFPLALEITGGTMLIPFLFLGAIDVLKQIGGYSAYSSNNSGSFKTDDKIGENAIALRKQKNLVLKFAITIFILIILMGTIYEPYGPLNEYSSADFNLKSVMEYNETLYDAYMAMVGLLPDNNPAILYQNNMPEVVFRDPSALTAELFGYSNNFTYPLGTSTGGPFWSGNISYIIADPYSPYFNMTGTGNFSLSMYETLQHFLSLNGYGIVGEYDGLMLLERGYRSPPKIYAPENRVFPATSLYASDGNGFSVISGNNISHNATLWYGPYTFLQPGTYKITLHVMATDISSSNRFQLRFSFITDEGRGVVDVLSLINVTGADFYSSNQWNDLTFTIESNNFYEFVEFAGQNFNWAGSFSISGISVTQVSGGKPS